MTTLALLWLPILLSAVFVFIASSVVHMVLPVHAGDYKKLPNEDRVREAMRAAGVGPGQYMLPGCESKQDYTSEALQQRFAEGPVGMLVVRPDGMPNMGKALLQWFVLCLVIGLVTAYLGGIGLAPGAGGAVVFRVTGTAALLGHAFSSVNDSIWKGLSWGVTMKFFFDGVIYALVTGATFAWLWPAAA